MDIRGDRPNFQTKTGRISKRTAISPFSLILRTFAAQMTITYRKRIADDMLRQKLESMGAVLIEGAKACGKTTTAAQQAASVLHMDDPRYAAQNLQMADTDPALLLAGATPRRTDGIIIIPLATLRP